MPSISEIIGVIESFAPTSLQESYDNAGLLTGERLADCKGVLLSLDCTEEVVDEAIQNNCNLIIAHHPVIFKGLKKLTGSNYVERTIIKAIKHDIAIYACHTNLDNVLDGVNRKMAEKLGLKNLRVLAPKTGQLVKLAVFVPATHEENVRIAILNAGAGHIGNYDFCSFNTEGVGTFRGNDQSNPFLGEKNKISSEKEIKVETIVYSFRLNNVLDAMRKAHPYEEIAYDIFPLESTSQNIGSGLIGELENELSETDFLSFVKTQFNCKALKHTYLTNKKIKTVALCGGSGQFLLKNAISSKSDSYISGDFKYHEFFDAEGKILAIDVGHYESEQYTPEIFYELITKKFPKFAIRLSNVNTNPVSIF